jgi:hypothetical protein
MKTIPAPPEKLSDLIELALGDLEKVEKDERYRVDMDEWHSPNPEACHVCFAGAVIVGTLGVAPNLWASPWQAVPDLWTDALCDLDTIRNGGRHLDQYPHLNNNCVTASYDTDPERFKSQLRQLISDLREVGE